MELVTIKSKYQVVIPRRVREQLRVGIGDLLEAKVERGKITLTPKSVVDRGIAEGLADFRAGRFKGPFASAEELIDSLRASTDKRKAGAQRRRR
jgi:AbrB family looped-hinge helix DNA binding protein